MVGEVKDGGRGEESEDGPICSMMLCVCFTCSCFACELIWFLEGFLSLFFIISIVRENASKNRLT